MNTIEIKTIDGISARICGYASDNYQCVSEYAARTCYHKEADARDGSWKRYLFARIQSGHESVIEHNNVTLMFQMSRRDAPAMMYLSAYIAKNNNLLRMMFNDDGTSLIISGNMRMFRDFFKNAYANMEKDKMVYRFTDIWYYYLFSAFMLLTNDDYIEDADGKRTNIFTYGLDLPLDTKVRVYEILKATGTPALPVVLDTENHNWDVKVIHIDYATALCDLLVNDWKFVEDVEGNKDILIDAIMNMAVFSYRVRVPRIISQQDTRHRIGAISQQSQRYVSASNADFYYNGNFGWYRSDVEHIYRKSIETYDKMVEAGIKKQDARFILPGGIYTEYVMTKPFFTLPHYFFERCSAGAQWEIRNIANILKACVKASIKYDAEYGIAEKIIERMDNGR